MSQDDKPKREGFRDGIRQGMGVLSAFKEAIEETISEARERGDLSPEKAKEVMRGALDKAQAAAGQAKSRFDLVTQREFEALKDRVADLARRVGSLDGEEEPTPKEPLDDGAPEDLDEAPADEASEEGPENT